MDRLRKGGALDGFGQSRPTLALQGELKRLAGWQTKGSELFEQVPDLEWVMPKIDPVEKSREEYPLLGMTISCPLQDLMAPVIRSGLEKAGFDPARLCPSSDIGKLLGKEVLVAGMVAAARRTHTKSGKTMQFLTLEDKAGFVDLTLFPGDCELLHHITEGPYVGIGKVEEDMGVLSVRAKRVFPLHGRGNVIPIRDETTSIGYLEEVL
jgi:DNA polymerase III alpha subunit